MNTTPLTDAISAPAELDGARRNGAHLLAKARSLGWQEKDEGAVDFLMRRAYEQGREDQRNGR